MGNSCVYKITSPSGKIYVGSTKNKKRRLNEYLKGRLGAQHKLRASFEKYSFENHVIDILWEGVESERFVQEFNFGVQFDVLDRNKGLNLKLPKINDSICCYSEDVIIKMKVARLGKSAYWNNKVISSYSLKGAWIKTFLSIKEASEYYNVYPTEIRNVLKNKGKRCHGVVFKYGKLKRDIKKVQLRKLKTNKKVKRTCIKDNQTEILKSVLEFTEKYNYLSANIYQCLNNKRKTAYGNKWKYV